ncbi:MAG: hypothetical protein U0869_11730 [Chloroflexota bacterium]
MRHPTHLASILSTPGAPTGGDRSTEPRAMTVQAREPGVIRVDPRPDTILIEVDDDADVEEGLEHLREELEALAFSSELI